mmetsp:Transcript_24416/g.60909  ORF Transcript_24416/g.60909 Transcript_24416/m.60909 type:complete len:170 (+) Transcript_24416:678-1187(+)
MRRDRGRIRQDESFKSFVAELEGKVQREGLEWMGARRIANVVHSFGVLDVTSRLLFDHVEDEAVRITEEGDPQNISNIAFAFEKLGEKRAAFFNAADTEKVSKNLGREGNPLNIATTISAFETLCHKANVLPALIETEEIAVKIVRDGAIYHISATISAMASSVCSRRC